MILLLLACGSGTVVSSPIDTGSAAQDSGSHVEDTGDENGGPVCDPEVSIDEVWFTEGDTVRIRFINQGSHPHTLHFHGWHHPSMDGSLPDQQVLPGEEFLYEIDQAGDFTEVGLAP